MVGVPLWRFKGSKVPLNLPRLDAWWRRFSPRGSNVNLPKTKRCVYFGYDDNALSGYAIMHTIHACFSDDDFPCRASSGSWDEHPPYDVAEDPLSPWLGPVGALQSRESESRKLPQALAE